MPYKLGISSMSLGRCFAGHSLAHKLDVARKYGYQGIELFHEDVLDLAGKLRPEPSLAEPSPEAQLAAASNIRSMCAAQGLEIICLQPFMNYEGLIDRHEHAAALIKLDLWIEMAHELQTDTIQIPSNYLPSDQVTDDIDIIVADLRKVADIGAAATPPVRFVYESLCWGTRVDVWEKCWEIVRCVDRDNFGICLDSFNIAGRVFADPTRPSGQNPDANTALRDSMARLVSQVDPRKVFYVQIVDAERLEQPLVEGHHLYDPKQPSRMSWSRNCRLFYGEKERGAYLPIREIAKALFDGLHFEGWVSLELFNKRMSDSDTAVPEELAQRGAVSWKKLVRDMKLDVDGVSA